METMPTDEFERRLARATSTAKKSSPEPRAKNGMTPTKGSGRSSPKGGFFSVSRAGLPSLPLSKPRELPQGAQHEPTRQPIVPPGQRPQHEVVATTLNPMPSSRRAPPSIRAGAPTVTPAAKPPGLGKLKRHMTMNKLTPDGEVKVLAGLADAEEGKTDRELLLRSQQLAVVMKERRRQWRFLVFFALLVLLGAGWKVFNLGSETITVVQRYDPTSGLDLEISGCDLDFVSGPEPTIKLSVMLKQAKARWQKRSTDMSIVDFAHLENGPGGKGCDALRPGVGCRRRCLITVAVTPQASTSAVFQVDQDPDDLDTPEVYLSPGVELHTLKISPTRGPRAVALRMDRATVRSELTAKLGFGEVRIHSSALPSDASIDSVYSAYLTGVSIASPVGGEQLHPQIQNMCAVGTTPDGDATAPEATAAIFPNIESSGTGEVVVTAPAFEPIEGATTAETGIGDDLPEPQPLLETADAERITATYGENYGDRDSESAGYITFDISGSVGVPRARFIYVTNPFFLLLDPALLKFLTAGVLMPDVFNEQVHFTGFSCALGPGDKMGPAARNATLSAMSEQLTKALHSDPDDEHPLRGVLIFSGTFADDGSDLPFDWAEPPLFHFPVHGVGLNKPEAFTNPTMQSMVKLSLTLCSAIGVLAGLLLVSMLFFALQRLVADQVSNTQGRSNARRASSPCVCASSLPCPSLPFPDQRSSSPAHVRFPDAVDEGRGQPEAPLPA